MTAAASMYELTRPSSLGIAHAEATRNGRNRDIDDGHVQDFHEGGRGDRRREEQQLAAAKRRIFKRCGGLGSVATELLS